MSGPHGLKGLSLLNVGNGHWQVAFHKVALYRFEGDKKKGQAHGQNVGHVWFAVLKSGIPASTAVRAPAAIVDHGTRRSNDAAGDPDDAGAAQGDPGARSGTDPDAGKPDAGNPGAGAGADDGTPSTTDHHADDGTTATDHHADHVGRRRVWLLGGSSFPSGTWAVVGATAGLAVEGWRSWRPSRADRGTP